MSDIDDCLESVKRLTRDRGEVMRAGSDKIEEIKERHFHDERWRNGPSMLCPQMHDDRAFLLAEDARHRAEIARLRAEMLHLAEWCDMEVPLTHDYMSYRLRAALERKP